MEREWERSHNQFHTIGYLDGLIAGEEADVQEGFNIGFKDSVLTRYNWGFVRGITRAMSCLSDGLKENLVEKEETRCEFRKLHEDVQSLSTMDALKLFNEDHKRKSHSRKEIGNPGPTEAVSNYQSLDIGVVENYNGQLQSLLCEFSMAEKIVFQ
ncbi:Essential protein Yae1- N-terminal [Striga hermonthica]|uniref:Essential protein Yae1- N-terminal n=1 Tax=Striga hermonthica TaxID=68872 RepID=A0A9N7R2I2_STRHE|nr:Essential protein Yae1- N-terminal [Striga hermonthica]